MDACGKSVAFPWFYGTDRRDNDTSSARLLEVMLMDETDTRVAFDYIKSNFFRVLHSDGAIGSITPSGGIHLAFYSERPAFPRRVVHALDVDGKLGALLPELTESRGSVVREMDVDVVLSIDAAKAVYEWLGLKINELNKNNDGEE